MRVSNQWKYRMLIVYPPATAGGTDPIQVTSYLFRVISYLHKLSG
jgi:hypothetical protein